MTILRFPNFNMIIKEILDLMEFLYFPLLLLLLFLFISFAISFFKYKKAEKKDKEDFRNEVANNFLELNKNMSILLKSNQTTQRKVTDLDFKIETEVINNTSLKEKLTKVVNSIYLNDNKYLNAIFFEKVMIIVKEVGSSYKIYKENKDKIETIDIRGRELIIEKLETILLTESLFDKSRKSILNLAEEILIDFNSLRAQSKKDTKILIANSFKNFIERAYNLFYNNNSISEAKEIAKTINNNIKKDNKIGINGNKNSAISDLSADNITINLSK